MRGWTDESSLKSLGAMENGDTANAGVERSIFEPTYIPTTCV